MFATIHFGIIFIPVSSKNLLIWAWNFCHPKGRPYIVGVLEQGAEENIWS